MSKQSTCLTPLALLGLGLVLSSPTKAQVTVTLGGTNIPGQGFTTSVAGATTEDFESRSLGFANFSNAFATYSASPDGGIISHDGALVPFGGENTNYIKNQANLGTTTTITLINPLTYFGLYWNSVDPTNTFKFYNGATLVDTITGSMVSGLTMNPGNFVNFFAHAGQPFTKIEIINTDTNVNFETDNHAYSTTATLGGVAPEPGTLCLLALGLVGGLAIRKRRSTANKVSTVLSLGGALAFLGTPAAHAQNLIQNPGFELGITNWNVTGNGMALTYALAGQAPTPPFGLQLFSFSPFDATPSAVLSQTFTTTPGTQYSVSFVYGNLNTNPSTVTTQQVLAEALNTSDSALLGSVTATDIVGFQTSFGAIMDTTYSFFFTATGPQTTLRFTDQAPDTISTDGNLDSVVVTGASAPEPGTLCLLALGLAGGMVARVQRRRDS